MRNTQFLNPVKRKAGEATSAISNLAVKVTSVLKNILGSIYQVESKHTVVDTIRNQLDFLKMRKCLKNGMLINKLKNRPLPDTRNCTKLGLGKNVDLTQHQLQLPASYKLIISGKALEI